MKPGRGRFDHSRDHFGENEGREPDGDGTALISRDDVVRLHDALRKCKPATHRRVGQWQTACLTNRAPEVRFLPRRLWPKSEVVETPGCEPGGSRFESGRSPHRSTNTKHQHRAGGVTGSATPLQGGGCGFESRAVHRTLADVAQSGEARRSERRQCGFESHRQYSAPHLGVAQWKRTGVGDRRWEFESLRPDQRNRKTVRDGGTGTTPAPEAGAPGSNPGLAAIARHAIDASAVVAFLEMSMSACCVGRGSFLQRQRSRVRIPPSFGA